MPMTFSRINIRIDAPAKQLVEGGIQRSPFEDPPTNLIPRKRWQVTHVEKKGMPPNYRLGKPIGNAPRIVP